MVLSLRFVIQVSSILLFSQPPADGQAVRRLYQPSAVPDRIMLTWAEDPRTTQAVTWRTAAPGKNAQAQVLPAPDGPARPEAAVTVVATSRKLTTNLGDAVYHTARFRNLRPGIDYVYRVGNGQQWSEWSQFRTAPATHEPFSFVYFGDAQNDLKSQWSRVIRSSYREVPRAAFLLHAGDLVNSAENDSEWGAWFYAGGFIHRQIPALAAPGNHEYAKRGDDQPRVLSRHWRPTFEFPANGPEPLRETAYWLDYPGARIVVLNSNRDIEVQAEWLDSVLADNPQTWTIVAFHHPIYSSKKGRDNAALRAAWQPVFDRHAVDLVLQGHDHTYARTNLVTQKNLTTGVQQRNPRAGTVYVVSVSGPKMYDIGRRPIMRRIAEDTQLFQVVSVDKDTLRYRAHTAAGRLYDGFELQKRPDSPNRLIEQIPETPERAREPTEAAGQ